MEREQELEGRLLDDEFLEEVAREAEKAAAFRKSVRKANIIMWPDIWIVCGVHT